MKIIAWYLPQFHEIPENNEWWGEGFTEWCNVKNAKAINELQNQPRVPLNGNYYNLLNNDVKHWQVELAKKYGVYGFCMHHYWFKEKMLLEKPMEQYLEDKSLDLPFCISWVNGNWTNQWVSDNPKILMKQTYGGKEEWQRHFLYLLQFFKDKRYIKVNGKPLLVVYSPEEIVCLNDMMDYWQELALKNDLPGLALAYQGMIFGTKGEDDDSRFMFNIDYYPGWYFRNRKVERYSNLKKIKDGIPKSIINIIKPIMYYATRKFTRVTDKKNPSYTYEEVWEAILNKKPNGEKNVPGAFVDWDNVSRKGNNATYVTGACPEKFEKYLEKQIINAKEIYNKDMIFIFSWNEWAEGGYLEPDELNKYGYLEAIKKALINTGEWEHKDGID